jgi:hypothetical protein
MKKALTIVLTVMAILMLSGQVFAEVEQPGIHGEVSGRWGMTEDEMQQWAMDLHYRFGQYISFGASQITTTDGYRRYNDAIIGYYPRLQLYEVYATLDISSVRIKVSQWCDHPIYSGRYTDSNNRSGWYIQCSYKF